MANKLDFKALLRKDPTSRTLNFRIDKFDEVGPVLIIARTKPAVKGRRTEEVYYNWVTADRFSFTLKAGQSLPLTIRGKRYPAEIGDGVITKETKKKQFHADKSTWTQENLWRGSKECHDQGFCVHDDDPYGPCLPSIDLASGVVRNAEEVWVIREDGPPCRESLLEETRHNEAIARGTLAIEVKKKTATMEPVHKRVSPVAPPPVETEA